MISPIHCFLCIETRELKSCFKSSFRVDSLGQHLPSGQTLLFVAYDGTDFFGSAWQPNVPTVQGELYHALKKVGLVNLPSDFRLVSRTDKGVHAISNVASCSFSRPPPLSAINMVLSRNSRIWVWGHSQLDEEVTVVTKEYAYYFPITLIPQQLLESTPVEVFVKELSERMSGFLGTHDFSAFIRKDKIDRDPVHTIYSIEARLDLPWIVMRFVGDGFGWEQIRRMVGFVFDSRWFSTKVSDLLDAPHVKPLSIKPAPPEFLVLEKMNFSPQISINHFKSSFKGRERYVQKYGHMLLRQRLMKDFLFS